MFMNTVAAILKTNLLSVTKSNKIKVKLSFPISKSYKKVSFGNLRSVALWFPEGRGLSPFVNIGIASFYWFLVMF